MAQQHLDPAQYGDYAQELQMSIAGAHVKWTGVPAHERQRIMPVIRQAADSLGATYDVSTETRPTYVYLSVKFREAPTPGDVLVLKGAMLALLAGTSWGGP